VAPVALNPIMAQMRVAGFKAAVSQRRLTRLVLRASPRPGVADRDDQVVVDIRTVCKIPVVLDPERLGDPVHIHRTVTCRRRPGRVHRIEDQLLRAGSTPRRDRPLGAVGLAAARSGGGRRRTDPTWSSLGAASARVEGMDARCGGPGYEESRRRHACSLGRKPEKMRFIAERLPAPLMTFAPPDGFSRPFRSPSEMARWLSPRASRARFAAIVKRCASYDCLAQDAMDRSRPGGAEREMRRAPVTASIVCSRSSGGP